jgi:hypothetical protein
MLLVVVGLFVLAVLWISALVMRTESAQSVWLWPLLVAIFLRQMVQRRVRRELRRKVDSSRDRDR